LKKLPEQRFETLKYILSFFSGKIENNNNCKVKMDSRDVASLAPVIASVMVETPNDYTLSSKIYKNGNVISYLPDSNNIDNIKNREKLIRFMIMNYSRLFEKVCILLLNSIIKKIDF